MTYTLGKFVWRELFTSDVAAAKAFYGKLFGWTAEDRPMGPDWSYTIFKLGDKQVGGMMDIASLPPTAGRVPAHWAVYVSVADVDQAAAIAEQAGGKVMSPCMDIPNVGRFAVIMDPQGGMLNVFRSAHGDPADDRPQPHEFCWENLSAVDGAKAQAFYERVIGWSAAPMGDSVVFNRQANGETVGVASMGQAPDGTGSYWAPFVGVTAIDPYLAQAPALNGKVLLGRTPIPDVGAFAVLEDPAGAVFFLFESRQ